MHLISIITPLYNSSDYLETAIQSVISQTYRNWEMIIVDDCSKDDSLEKAQRYAALDARIKVLQLAKNSGAAAARNAAIEISKGRFIAFLDSDDLWEFNKLERQIQYMLINDVDFSYTAYEKIDENGKAFSVMGVPQIVSYVDLLKTNCIGCLTAIYDTKKIGKVYMPINTKREDCATWLAILKKIDYAYGMNEVLAQYRVYDSQTSSKKAKMAKENWRLYRDVEKLGLLKSVYYFSHYAIRGVLRTKFPRLARLIRVLN
ncbi:MAG: glycosyltransferase [Chitinophagaceae bacterium]|nr:glycosyltransferase [Chitinophagaceae bacterium]